jgi:hypothetical protein
MTTTTLSRPTTDPHRTLRATLRRLLIGDFAYWHEVNKENNAVSLTSDRSGHRATQMADALTKKVRIDYTNYRGERAVREVVPHSIWHGTTDHHPKAQWLMTAWDVDKRALRTFALCDVHAWEDL